MCLSHPTSYACYLRFWNHELCSTRPVNKTLIYFCLNTNRFNAITVGAIESCNLSSWHLCIISDNRRFLSYKANKFNLSLICIKKASSIQTIFTPRIKSPEKIPEKSIRWKRRREKKKLFFVEDRRSTFDTRPREKQKIERGDGSWIKRIARKARLAYP